MVSLSDGIGGIGDAFHKNQNNPVQKMESLIQSIMFLSEILYMAWLNVDGDWRQLHGQHGLKAQDMLEAQGRQEAQDRFNIFRVVCGSKRQSWRPQAGLYSDKCRAMMSVILGKWEG